MRSQGMQNINVVTFDKELNMKATSIFLSVILTVLIVVGIQWLLGIDSPQTYFRPSGSESASELKSLQRKVNYIEGKIGITSFDFEFSIPKDKKLVVTFSAELDGKVEPTLSKVWHIPSSDKSENRPGSISIHNFVPPVQTQDQYAVWEVSISSPSANNHSHIARSPYTLQKNIGYDTSTGSSVPTSLEVGKEYKVWDYHKFDSNPDKSLTKKPFDFKYKMSILITGLEAGEKLERIRIDQ